MLAYIFPGQGSQSIGMGQQLFDAFPGIVEQADSILGYSIKNLCLEDPHKQLNQTQYTQPALYIVNALHYLKKIQETQRKPDFVSGHSLGEYTALFAAGVFDFQTGLQLVKKRGELMSQATGGAMAAIIGIDMHAIKNIIMENNLSTLAIANANSYLQSVISGPQNDIATAQQIFAKYNAANFIPLKVSGAFHSKYMESAQQQFYEFLNQFTYSTPTIPVIANTNALPYHPAVIKLNLSNQITYPVLWVSIMEYFFAFANISLEEVGPGNVLSGLVRRFLNKQ